MTKHGLLLCSFILLLCTSVRAQKTDWTISDILHQESMRSVTFSPDGNMVLWSKRRAGKEKAKDRFVSDLYLTRLTEKKDGEFRTTQLTRTEDSDFSARFSRDGESILFLSGREKGKKLWKMSLYGGEAEAIHEFKNGISSPQWLNDSTLVFSSYDGKNLVKQELEKKKDNVIVVEDTSSWKITHLYSFDLKKKKISRVTDNKKPVRGFSVSKDGKQLAYWLAGSPHQSSDAQPKSKYYLKSLETGLIRQILQGIQTPGSITFTDDSKGMYIVGQLSGDPEWDGAGIGELYFLDVASARHRKVDLDWEMGIGGGIAVTGNDVIVSLANRATRRLARYNKSGYSWKKQELELGDMKDHADLYALSEAGDKMIFRHSTTMKMSKFYVADLSGATVKNHVEVVKLNKKLAKKKITKSEVVEWIGWNGDTVNGLLYYPEDYKEGRAYPLMLSIHGGPAGADLDNWSERWSTYPQLLAQRGSFVLKPNYHGSSNHGLKWVESIKKNYYDPEMEDIMNGVNWLIEQGKVHKDSVGSMGWSNGAILTTMLTVRYPEMFKVACPGAGDVNWTSDYGTCGFGVSFDQSYFGGAPWDNVDGKTYNEAYILKSPLFDMENVTTPTIIFHGSEDRAVPRDQGWEYYRALQQIGKAPVRFLWFPGQPHGLGKITHQTRKMEEELAWIDKYLFGKEDKKNKAFKKGSPLDKFLAKDTLAMDNGNYGVLAARTLVPETVLVAKDSISIGRFEVTNAQYKTFDQEHAYGANGGNHPARVTRAQAGFYLKWLSEKLGKTARLPNAAEAKSLHKKATAIGAKGNTLNYWAGYAITPAEVTDFRRKMEDVKTTLYMPVGSFAPTKIGKASIYDLGGNVAEMGMKGSYGYGAYDFVDALGEGDRMDRELGFRVVVE